jgi:hypothetical protein
LNIVSADCDFDNPDADVRAKKVKSNALAEIVRIMTHIQRVSKEDADKLFGAVMWPLFRDVREEIDLVDRMVDSGDLYEPGWVHYSMHYEIVTGFVNHGYAERACKLEFVRALIARFYVPDANERSALGKLVIAICERKPELGEEVLKLVLNETAGYRNGYRSAFVVAPSLRVCGYFRSECVQTAFYPQYILPLIACRHYPLYHRELSHLALSFPKETGFTTARYIIRCFPVAAPAKAVLLLDLLHRVLASMPTRMSHELLPRVARLTAACARGGHVALVQASRGLWDISELQGLFLNCSKIVFPLVYQTLSEAERESWSPAITTAIQETYRSFERIDRPTFTHIIRSLGRSEPDGGMPCWARVLRQAYHADPCFNLSMKFTELQTLLTASKSMGGVPGHAGSSRLLPSASQAIARISMHECQAVSRVSARECQAISRVSTRESQAFHSMAWDNLQRMPAG